MSEATSGLSSSPASCSASRRSGTVVLATEVQLLGPDPGVFQHRRGHLFVNRYLSHYRRGVTVNLILHLLETPTTRFRQDDGFSVRLKEFLRVGVSGEHPVSSQATY